jgi:hypothetical protein
VKNTNWLCLGLFSPNVQYDISLISPCNNAVYTHSAFSQIGFVLHNLVKMIARFLALATDLTDEHGLDECLYVVSRFTHLLIESST